ncbi:Holliday junction resolvase RuvX [Yimella sp. cx-573]|nr:Holliday junction resolvase RuvX [Yimella sp. cx-573]
MRRGVRIGADVGSVRVGISICDPDGLLATPETTFARDAAKDRDIEQVLALVDERAAIEVIVGLPRSMSGDEGPAALAARSWATALRRRRPELSVRMVDERLTTVDAHRVMRDAGISTRRSRSVIDSQAAAMILQVALDTERTTGTPPGVLVGARKARHRGRGKKEDSA